MKTSQKKCRKTTGNYLWEWWRVLLARNSLAFWMIMNSAMWRAIQGSVIIFKNWLCQYGIFVFVISQCDIIWIVWHRILPPLAAFLTAIKLVLVISCKKSLEIKFYGLCDMWRIHPLFNMGNFTPNKMPLSKQLKSYKSTLTYELRSKDVAPLYVHKYSYSPLPQQSSTYNQWTLFIWISEHFMIQVVQVLNYSKSKSS